MKKTKRLLSALTALTITASAFAGMVIPASAAVTPFSQDYEASGVVADWTSGNESRYTVAINGDDANHYLEVASTEVTQNNGATVTTNDKYTGKVDAGDNFTMTFDLSLTGGNNQNGTDFKVLSNDGYILSIKQIDNGGKVFMINEDPNLTLDYTDSPWYSFKLSRKDNLTFLTVTKKADGSTVLAQTPIALKSAKGGIANLSFNTGRYYANMKLDNVVIKELADGDVPNIEYYNIAFKTQRYAKIVYKLGDNQEITTYADANGEANLANLQSDTDITYTISKEGYAFEGGADTKTETFTLTEDKTINAPMTLSEDIGVTEDDLIYYENTFGYEANNLAVAVSNRMCDTALGTIEPGENIYEIVFDVNIPEAETDQVTMAFFATTPGTNTDKNDLFGIQGNAKGLFAFSNLKPKSSKTETQGWNQNCAELYENGVKLADEYTGSYKVDMIVDNAQKKVTVKAGENTAQTISFTKDASKITYLRISKGGANKTLSIDNLIVKKPDQNYVGVYGDNEFAKITGKTVTRQYTAEALVAIDGETFTWTVENKDDAGSTTGVSIDQNGLLSVTDQASAGIYTVKAASTVGDVVSTTKIGTFDVNIADIQEYIPTVDVPAAIEKGTTGKLSVTKITDALGDDVTEYFSPTWSIDGAPDMDKSLDYADLTPGDATAIYATYDGTVLTSVESENVTVAEDGTLSVTAPSGAKVYIWNSLDGMKPVSTEVKTAPATTLDSTQLAAIGSRSGTIITNSEAESGTVTVKLNITGSDDTPSTYAITVDNYSKIVDYTQELTSVSVADIIDDSAITGYLVTVADADGNQLAQEVVQASGSAVAVPTVSDGTPAKVEVAPVFEYTEGLSDIYATPFTIPVPNDKYDVDFSKVTTGRVDLKVNGYIVVENAGMGGNGRGVSETRTYSADNVVVSKGKAVISGDGTCELDSITISKTPEIVNRKTHIWIGGDSTVCVYYGNEETGDVTDMQTGWGQVFETYLDDSVTVVDLAESGSYVHRWFYEEYPTVRDMAQPGDYFIIQMGINDRSHADITNEADMTALLGQMVDELRAKGVIPVLVTPQKSKGYAWYTADSTKGDITTWNGAGISWSSYGFGTGVMKSVAEDKGTLFVDNASLSAEEFFKLGADYVIENFHLSNEHSTNKEMHFSYAGAQKIASMIAQSIYDQTKAGKTTAMGETFDGIAVTTEGAGFTFTDSNGDSQTYNVVDSTN